jgi:hypothetical protein
MCGGGGGVGTRRGFYTGVTPVGAGRGTFQWRGEGIAEREVFSHVQRRARWMGVRWWWCGIAGGGGSARAGGRKRVGGVEFRPWASNVIVCRSRGCLRGTGGPVVQITEVAAGWTSWRGGPPRRMDISLSNPAEGGSRGNCVVPVPDGAAVRGFTFQGGGAEPQAAVLPRRRPGGCMSRSWPKARDPALLDVRGLQPDSIQRLPDRGSRDAESAAHLRALLPADSNRVEYVLPRTESVQYMWPLAGDGGGFARRKRPISTVYSPSTPWP